MVCTSVHVCQFAKLNDEKMWVKMAWGDDDGGDKKKGCSKCGEKIREIYVPKEEIDDSKLFESLAVICVNGM